MAYEMKDKLRREDQLTVVNLGTSYSFVPSNPWVAVGWREREDITVDLTARSREAGIGAQARRRRTGPPEGKPRSS